MCGLLCGCIGGPISDLPNSRSGEQPSNNPGEDQGNNNAGGGNSPGGNNGGGTPGGGIDDPGGVGGDGDGDGYTPGAPTDGDAGVSDDDAGSADGGPTTPGCDYVPPDGAEACAGAFCGLSAAELEAQIMPGGACVTHQSELALVCSNTLSVTVSRCFQDALGAGAFRLVDVDACALKAPEVAAASADCVRCYLEETRCALTRCLVYCLSDNSEADCKSCRESQCGEAFRTCSGLPAAP